MKSRHLEVKEYEFCPLCVIVVCQIYSITKIYRVVNFYELPTIDTTVITTSSTTNNITDPTTKNWLVLFFHDDRDRLVIFYISNEIQDSNWNRKTTNKIN